MKLPIHGVNFFLHGYSVMLQAEYAWLLDQTPGGQDLVSHQARLQLLFKL